MRRDRREGVFTGSEDRAKRTGSHAVDRLPNLRRDGSDPVERRKRKERLAALALGGIALVELGWVVLILVSLYHLLT